MGFQRYSILGFCAGGATGLILASYYPEVVEKLVCWGAKAFISDDDREALNKFLAGVLRPSTEPRTQPEVSMDLNVQIYGDSFPEMGMRFVTAILKMNDICTGELPSVKCPVLILHGKLDTFVLEKHAHYLHENIKGSKLHFIADGKHFLQHKPEFYQVVETFLLQSSS